MIYLRLIWAYLKIGLFGFGGGYAMLALIEREIVGPGWIARADVYRHCGDFADDTRTYRYQFRHIYRLCRSCWYSAAFASPIYGILGSLLCTFVVSFPSFVLVAYTSHLIRRHRDSVVVKGIFAGLRPVVVGLIASAALLLMNSANFGETSSQVLTSIAICIGAFILVYWVKWHPILIICLAELAGWIIY